MDRREHTFQFRASQIAAAAKAEAEYHRKRERYWRDEFCRSLQIVKDTAAIKVEEVPVTGGVRVELRIDYGDMAALLRMNEAQAKIQLHVSDAERFETDAILYGTQSKVSRQSMTVMGTTPVTEDRLYELSAADVHHYRLASQPRGE